MRRIAVVSVLVLSGWLSVPAGAVEAQALAEVAQLEVSEGRRGFVARGMGIGFLAGAAAGVLTGAITGAHGNDGYLSREVVTGVLAVAGGLAGSVVGGVVGAIVRRERWTDVRLEQPLRRVSMRPSLGVAEQGVRLQFAC